jgi:hypothetical protein
MALPLYLSLLEAYRWMEAIVLLNSFSFPVFLSGCSSGSLMRNSPPGWFFFSIDQPISIFSWMDYGLWGKLLQMCFLTILLRISQVVERDLILGIHLDLLLNGGL